MKIETQKDEFKPITITLETEEEARAVMSAVGHIHCNGGVVKNTIHGIFNYLYEHGFRSYEHSGSLTIKS